MKTSTLARVVSVALLSTIISVGTIQAAPKPEPTFDWVTVVNNNDTMPGTLETLGKERTFNSYNQPSVNLDGLVVFRARSKGGDKLGPPTHGIYTRDMFAEGEIVRILDRTTEVPGPNNLGTTFVETPSFPRIDMGSATIATRGNHPPVYKYEVGFGSGDSFTKAGTTGIYTNPFGELITGAGKLGNIGDFYFFEVPYELPGTLFEVFPGSPSVTNVDTIVFKGNYTAEKGGRTGVYYRQLDNDPAGGISPVVLIANNTVTLIPGTQTFFGSTSPPSAANGLVVFAGFDNEQEPTLGGIYLAPLQSEPELTTLVHIGGKVSGERGRKTFNGLGEGGAFDGRFVGFWGAWGEDSKTVRLYCPTEGNKDRIAYCNRNLVCQGEEAEPIGDTSSICDDKNDPNYGISCYQEREVPVNQGLFVHDINTDKTWTVAKTGKDFNDFLYWNFSGMTPCKGSGHHSKAGAEEGAEDDGEPARWRSSAFITVAGKSADFNAAFKARTGELDDYDVYTNPVDGIYLKRGGPSIKQAMVTVLDTTMEGQILDPDADGWTIMELGIEREGLRGEWLTINAKMGIEGGTEEEGLAGIYLTKVPKK